nr:uncharacterized protein LOC127330875 [Lolium perenne]
MVGLGGGARPGVDQFTVDLATWSPYLATGHASSREMHISRTTSGAATVPGSPQGLTAALAGPAAPRPRARSTYAAVPGLPEQVASEVGKHLAQPRLGKDALVKLLQE